MFVASMASMRRVVCTRYRTVRILKGPALRARQAMPKKIHTIIGEVGIRYHTVPYFTVRLAQGAPRTMVLDNMTRSVGLGEDLIL